MPWRGCRLGDWAFRNLTNLGCLQLAWQLEACYCCLVLGPAFSRLTALTSLEVFEASQVAFHVGCLPASLRELQLSFRSRGSCRPSPTPGLGAARPAGCGRCS